MHTGVVDPRSDHLLHHPRRRQATSKEVRGEHYGLSLSEGYRRFLDKAVFDREGQRARHGRDDDEHRTYALFAAVGVLGWLAAYGDRGPLDTLTARLNAVVDPELAAGAEGPDESGG